MGRELLPTVLEGFCRDFLKPGEDTRPPFSRSKTMCFPIRCTSEIRFASRAATISDAGDFNGSGFDPSHTDSMTSPLIRFANPRATVSTSGSSGIRVVYRLLASVMPTVPCSLRPPEIAIPRWPGYHCEYTSAPFIPFVNQRFVCSVRATSVCDPVLRLGSAAPIMFKGVSV